MNKTQSSKTVNKTVKVIFLLALLLITIVAMTEGEIWIFSSGNIGSTIVRVNESFTLAFVGIVAFVVLLSKLDNLTED